MLLRDDVDYSGYGVASVERRGGPFHNLDALDVGRIQQVEVVLPTHVAVHALAVNQDKDVVVVQPVELDVAAHTPVVERERRGEPCQQLFHTTGLELFQSPSCNDFGLYGSVLQIMFGPRSCYDHFFQHQGEVFRLLALQNALRRHLWNCIQQQRNDSCLHLHHA